MSLRLSTTSTKPPAPSPAAPPIPSTTHLDRVSYLFGYPISHSLSPLLHGTIYDSLSLKYEQHLYETSSLESCLPLMQSSKFFGASVTMPFKVSIIPHLDSLTAEAEAIGAVNTVFLLPDAGGRRRLCGTNTDCIGVREAIIQNSTEAKIEGMRGRPGMVIGGGGTSRAAIYALKRFLGCSTIYLVNREKSEVDQVIAECKSKGFGQSLQWVGSIAEAQELEAPGVVVSAIPDFPPKTEKEIRTRKIIETILGKGVEKGVLLEMCYSEGPNTQIAVLSRARGWQVVEGTEAMIWQGLEQDRVWLKREVKTLPIDKVKNVIRTQVKGQIAKAKL
ncbi:quinate dehydrogenase [Phlyctema vagabunda]|uniref:Quinate dehydrogenase n=1 Tax=Phlyctema vagabunda TaxID=108571 RepID=A0ABR4PAG4_9HELO